MARIKEKIDVIIDNITYRNIDIYKASDNKYTLDTTGIAQVIKQFVKNTFGDIKVWAKSDSFAGGSSIDVYLWEVPKEWKEKVEEFADRFGQYNDYNYGGWRGRSVGAFTTDGENVSNFSPYMNVYNRPPSGSKESDMPPPNYAEKPTPKKKEYERKGGKYSPTDNLDLVLDCGNGWKIYVGKPKEKYLYNVVKDKDTKQNKEQWAEIKADMLEAGFQWAYKVGTFQRWTTIPDDTLPQQACNVLSKYWGGSSEPKEEAKDFNIGDKIKYIGANTEYIQNGDIGIITDVVTYKNGDIEFEVKFESKNDKFMFPKYKLELLKEEDGLPFYLGENVVLNANIEFKNKYYSIGTKGTIVNFDNDKKEASVYFDNGVIVPNISFNYIDKYSNGSSQPKEETPQEPQVMIPQGTEFELMEDVGTLKKGDTGVFAEDYIPRYAFLDAYMNSEARPDFIYTIPFKKIRIIEEAPREEIPKEEKSKEFKVGDKVRLVKDINEIYPFLKIELGVIGIVKNDEGGLGKYYDVEFNGIEIYLGSSYFELVEEEILPFVSGQTIMLKMPFTYNNSTYPKGLRGEIKNIDYVRKTAYVYFYGDDSGNYPVPFEYLEKFVDTYETPKEVNLDEYLNDLNVLLEIEDDETKRLELATYISDLNTLKLLQ